MPNTYVIFGASGDLTSRKLIPALYQLFCKERLPKDTRIVGFARTPFTDESWRNSLAESTKEFVAEAFSAEHWAKFAANVHYQPGDIEQADDFSALATRLAELEGQAGATRIYYLATAPQFYERAAQQLGDAGLADESVGIRRIVVEKPFGVDRASAKHLTQSLHQVFDEEQIFRIDHYLGKETVQNMLVLRFANSIFEPLWNRNYIDHVQITAAEEVTVGRRAGYYDTAGVLRDMFQNHLLQLLMVTAMEAPVRFDSQQVRDEKVKVLQAIRPLTDADVESGTLRGQYRGYLDEPGVRDHSRIATFGVVKLAVDNWRWQGVPFYLRSGKAMSCRTTQIVIQFRQPPHLLFAEKSTPAAPQMSPANKLIIQIQPAEGIQLHFQTKVPDAGMKLRLTDLDFSFQREFNRALPEAYERLLLDTLVGDTSLFARADEVDLAWGIIDPIDNHWANNPLPTLEVYEAGLWGPDEATAWMEAQGRQWFDSCPVLH
jgi:glucose-6-phosphate 1-dehydrogenase